MDNKKNAYKFTVYFDCGSILSFIVAKDEKPKIWEAFHLREAGADFEFRDMEDMEINIAPQSIIAFHADELDYEEYKAAKDRQRRMAGQIMSAPPFIR